jgi:hypothetical protein
MEEVSFSMLIRVTLYTHRTQKVIASHVMQVIGLSSSNETVENAYFMACHLLYRCKFFLPVAMPPTNPDSRCCRWTLPAPSRRKAGITKIPDSGRKLGGLANGMDYPNIRRAVERTAGVGFMGAVVALYNIVYLFFLPFLFFGELALDFRQPIIS